MTKRRYKDVRKEILQKYEIPLTEMPDEVLKDKNGWIWLRDLIDYRRQSQNGFNLTQNKVEFSNIINKTVGRLKVSRGVRNWNY